MSACAHGGREHVELLSSPIQHNKAPLVKVKIRQEQLANCQANARGDSWSHPGFPIARAGGGCPLESAGCREGNQRRPLLLRRLQLEEASYPHADLPSPRVQIKSKSKSQNANPSPDLSLINASRHYPLSRNSYFTVHNRPGDPKYPKLPSPGLT